MRCSLQQQQQGQGEVTAQFRCQHTFQGKVWKALRAQAFGVIIAQLPKQSLAVTSRLLQACHTPALQVAVHMPPDGVCSQSQKPSWMSAGLPGQACWHAAASREAASMTRRSVLSGRRAMLRALMRLLLLL